MKQYINIKDDENIILSVIVSVYNVKEYLDECLQSLVEQESKNVEFIIVDDGSTDGSAEICDQWGQKDKRITIIHHEQNKGLLLARKTGIDKSKGRKIVFLDGDDKFTKETVSRLLQIIRNNDSEIIQFSVDIYNCVKNELYYSTKSYLKNDKRKIDLNLNLANDIFVSKKISWTIWNKIYESILLKKVSGKIENINLTLAEDTYYSFLISYFARSYYSIKTKPLYLYRLNTGISTKKPNLYTFHEKIKFKLIIESIKKFLLSENASKEWMKFLESLENCLYSGLVYEMSRLYQNESQYAFNLLCKNYKIIHLIPLLEKYFIEKQNELAELYLTSYKYGNNHYKSRENKQDSQKTLGIFYHRYYNGGVERVISLQIPLFIQLGYRIVLFTEEINKKLEYNLPEDVIRIQLPVSYCQNRASILIHAINTYNISILCHHATSSPRLLFDLILLREMQINSIITLHGTSSYMFSTRNKYIFNGSIVYKLADTVLTLSKCEENFYHQCGINAKYMPNPVVKLNNLNCENVKKERQVVIWVGRLSKEKNYKEALKIFKKVIQNKNNVLCYMIGSGNNTAKLYINFFIYFNKLQGKLIHIPYTKDVSYWYKKASIHLLTSSFESFSMVIAESKTFGLPLVTYDLPVVEILRDGKGYVNIKPHNIHEATSAILEILNNRKYAEHLSREALESIQSFQKFDLLTNWSNVLKEPCANYCTNVSEEESTNMKLFWNNTILMYHEGLKSQYLLKQYIHKIIKFILMPMLPPQSKRREYVKKIYYKTKEKMHSICLIIVRKL